MSARDPIVVMKGVSKTYATPGEPTSVLRSVDVSIEPGDFVAVTGPSGSGKTTFLNLAGLLDNPTSGEIRFEGRDVHLLDEDAMGVLRKEKVGMVFQSFHLLGGRSVLENVVFRFRYLDVPEADAAESARTALELVGLSGIADKPVRLLSGGEMQRVAIARAVAHIPSLLLADEPTGNLDAATAHAIMEHFQALNRMGITILLATHNEALLPYCSRRLACDEGTIREGSLPNA